jgi:hypothetical protein
MDKTIIFKGKLTVDKINNLKKGTIAKRNELNDLSDEFLSYERQVKSINQLFMDGECENMKLLKREIEKKITSYKTQDISKKIYNESSLISLSEAIEKLVCSKLKCHYCKESVLLFYKNVRDSKQWTLDRIDNDLCHSNENTLIACLHCNLQRRTRDMEKFLFTKQLKIKKQD